MPTIITKIKHALYSLFFFDDVKAGITHPHRELKAHDWKCGALRATFSTHSLAALPAVVLHTRNTLKILQIIMRTLPLLKTQL